MLYERTATWGGRVPVRNKTISILSITLNVVRKKYNIPFLLTDILPHDFDALFAIPSSSNMLHSAVILKSMNEHKDGNRAVVRNSSGVGGAFLIGSNAILHFGQTIDCGLTFNLHGDSLKKDFPSIQIRQWTERVINLEHCTLTPLGKRNHTDFLMSDGDGFLYLLNMKNTKMTLCTVGNGPIPQTMTSLQNDWRRFVFIGSRLGHSLLVCHKPRKQKKDKLKNGKNGKNGKSDGSAVLGKEEREKKERQEMTDLAMEFFGGGPKEDQSAKAEATGSTPTNSANPRKRTYSEMERDNPTNPSDSTKIKSSKSDKEENEENDDNDLDLALDLFGVTTETLAAAAEKKTDENADNTEADKSKSGSKCGSKSPSKSGTPAPSRHETLYGPKVKRRKLSQNKQYEMYSIRDLQFMNLADFNEDKLFETEIQKEAQSRPQHDGDFMEMDQGLTAAPNTVSDAQIKRYTKEQDTLRMKYEFRVHDTMSNLSPITSLVMGKSHDPRYLHNDYIDMMASTGYGTQGKLSVVQEGVRPQILAKTNSRSIVQGVGCWTLYKPQDSNEENTKNESQYRYHSYLVSSDLQQTQVLKIEGKMVPIPGTAFKTDIRTIECGHIGGDHMLTVQIHPFGVRLIKDLSLLYEYNMRNHTENQHIEIVDGYICDPFVLLHCSDQSVALLTLKIHNNLTNKGTVTFEVKRPDLPRYDTITETEKERRRKVYVSRKCNGMTWDQYVQLESCINDFIRAYGPNNDALQNIDEDMPPMEVDFNSLIRYIDETLVNPPEESPDNDENGNGEEATNGNDDGADDGDKDQIGDDQKEENQSANPEVHENGKSLKDEASDSDDDDIKLAEHLRPAGVPVPEPVTQNVTSTGWQADEWDEPNTAKKSLFDLDLSIRIALKRLFGNKLDDSFSESPRDILEEMITTDLDRGTVDKIYLFQSDQLKTKTLRELDTEWKAQRLKLAKHNPSSFLQLLSSSFQIKRLDLMAEQERQRLLNRKRKKKGQSGSGSDDLDDEQALVRQMMFGDDAAKPMDVDDDDGEEPDSDSAEFGDSANAGKSRKHSKEKKKRDLSAYTMAVVVRSSGTMQIFKVPTFEMVFECKEIHLGHEVLKNGLIHDNSLTILLSKRDLRSRKPLRDLVSDQIASKLAKQEVFNEDEVIPLRDKDELWCPAASEFSEFEDEEQDFETRKVEEIFVNTLDESPYLLLVLSNGDILIYRMFEHYRGGSGLLSTITPEMDHQQFLPLGLRRFAHKLYSRKTFTVRAMQNQEIDRLKRKVHAVDGMNGLQFVLVTGNHSAVIFSHRGCPIVHDFSSNDDVRGFCMFNHQAISAVAQDERVQNGCVWFTQYGMCIATIPTTMHNIGFFPNVFRDIDGHHDDVGDGNGGSPHSENKKSSENAEDLTGNGDDDEKKKKEAAGTGDGDDDKKEKEKENEKEKEDAEDAEDDDENGEEIFGHSFVLMKQRLNNEREYIDIDYTAEYPVAHIPLSETLHFVVQHPQSGTYLLVMSRSKYIVGTEMLKSRDIRPTESYFECRLLNPFKWRFDDRLTDFTLHRGGSADSSIPISEHILCGESVTVTESPRIGALAAVKKQFIVLGTGTNQGEDCASIGRIVILEVIAERESMEMSSIEAPSSRQPDERDERFYVRSSANSETFLSDPVCATNLEDGAMADLYANSSPTQKEYYRRELKYYKKCVEQDVAQNLRYRLHFVFARRERAAVTAVNCVSGLIIAAIGPKLLLFRWDGTQLIGCAFLDTRIHCHNILVMKNLVATSDLFQGLDLYHWEHDIASIVQLARDVQYRSVYTVKWLVHRHRNRNGAGAGSEDQNEFELLVSDMHQNVHIISYAPFAVGWMGRGRARMDKAKLYTRCCFHIGTNISESIPLKFRDEKNYFNLSGCTDGSVHYLIPISDQVHGRLSTLHSQMLYFLEMECGLNPREYRYAMNNAVTAKDMARASHIMFNHSALNAMHGMDCATGHISKNIVDADLLEKFRALDYRTQSELTKNVGVSSSSVLVNHLSKLHRNTKWF